MLAVAVLGVTTAAAVAVPCKLHDLEATVMRGGALVPLPTPLYITDTYMGGWNQFDLSIHPTQNLSSEVFYTPDPAVAGNYSTANFGSRDFVRRRLALMQRSGLTPAIHIMAHRLIYRNATSGAFELQRWADEGARVDGVFMNSVELFTTLYRPILEELEIPYILIYGARPAHPLTPCRLPSLILVGTLTCRYVSDLRLDPAGRRRTNLEATLLGRAQLDPPQLALRQDAPND
jgi:hypothetical protein